MELKRAKGSLTRTYNFSDISVTENDKVLVTNDSSLDPLLFVFSDFTYESKIRFSSIPRCVAVIPGTDKAVVTLPEINRIQFINTSKMTSGDKVNVRFRCIAIAAGSDKIYVGGNGGTIKTLNIDGTVLTTLESVNLKSDIHFMLYDDFNEQIIARIEDKLCV
ncbi:unnamed protein product [Mytilus edulis]|uniref:Uncharacterized protein n=1 Tax=Mytilus edulis TaxID=6550 RepID=A0A8S3U2G7_MYTED|nr:unnamed protein product [Mytilus edulis]